MNVVKRESTSDNNIPLIIHYCWFGKKPLPEEFEKNISSWKKDGKYEIIEWNEDRCSFSENAFVKKAYEDKMWAFVCDYYRLVALYEYGGIYMDTDVKLFKDFGDLLKYPMFMGFIYNCAIGTAVIGVKAHHPVIAELLDMYNRTVFVNEKLPQQLVEREGKVCINHYVTNNYYFTYYLLKKYPQFLLNNKKQNLGDIIVLPKEYFETGSLLGYHYTIHFCSGTWKNKKINPQKEKMKQLFELRLPKLYLWTQTLIRLLRYKRDNKNIPFYDISKKQRFGTKGPLKKVGDRG